MAQAHFFEVTTPEGDWTLVRVDKIEAIRPSKNGLVLCTAAGEVEAYGETRESLKAMMQSAQVVLVAITGPRKVAPSPELEETDAPARAAVVRAPPPVEVPGVTDVEDEAPASGKKRKA